jgi:hypothetical protein
MASKKVGTWLFGALRKIPWRQIFDVGTWAVNTGQVFRKSCEACKFNIC